VIDEYLRELYRELRGVGRRRRRLLAEVREHLLEAGGDEDAIRRFGPAKLIARRFRDELGDERARTAVFASVALAAAVGAASLLNPRLNEAPASIAWTLLAQVIFVTAGLTAARLLLGVRERALLVRGSGTAATAALTLLALESASWIALAVVLPVGVLAVLAVARAARLAGASHPHDLGDDLAALQRLAPQSIALLSGLLGRLRLDPRAHLWRFAVGVAVCAGLAAGVGHGVTDGGLPTLSQLPLAVAGTLIIASMEAVAALAGYVLLGGFLGLRPAYQSRVRR
jgi:hypothetical protein